MTNSAYTSVEEYNVEKAKKVTQNLSCFKDILVFGKADGCLSFPQLLEDDGYKYTCLPKRTVDFAAVSFVYKLLKNPKVQDYDLTCVKIISTGAPLNREANEVVIINKFPLLKSVRQMYGLSETMALSIVKKGNVVPNSVGKLFSSTQLKMIDVTTSIILGANECGEFYVRGGQIMKGYLKNPKMVSEIISADGWFVTGDYGYYDSEGNLYVTDRIKEMIKTEFHQVSLTDIESLLHNYPAVEDTAVIGIVDASLEKAPRGYVVLKQGCKVEPAELLQFVSVFILGIKMQNTQMSQLTGFQFFLLLLLSMKTATSDKSQTIQNEKKVAIVDWEYADPPVITETDKSQTIQNEKEVAIAQWGHVDPPIITDFICKCVHEGVYYADIKLKCKVFHTCTKSSTGHLFLNSFRCSEGTAFRQDLQICDFKDNVLCDPYPMPCTSSTTTTTTASSTSSSTTTKMLPVKVSVPKINKEYFKVQQQKPAVRPIVMSPEKLPFPNTFLFDNVFPSSKISNIYKRYCSDELNPRSVIIDIKDVQSTFTCADKVPGAHYSDPELDCTVYHVCVEVSEKSLADTQFQCPLGTAFNQELLQCVPLGTFDCSKVSQYFAGEKELQTRSEKLLKKIPTINFAVGQLCKVLKQQLPR